MEDMDLEGMDDDGGDDGADDMNEALEDMEEIDEYVQARGVRERLFKRFLRLKSGQFHLNLNV